MELELQDLRKFHIVLDTDTDDSAGPVEEGRGSYGAVFRSTLNGADCVGKKIHEIILTGLGGNLPVEVEEWRRLVRNFAGEIRLLSEQRHPNIVQFLGVCGLDGDPRDITLVMECMDTSLQKLIEQPQIEIPLDLKVSILKDTSCGICHLHSKGIVHRDLNAGNVLLTSSLRAKVADLGISRVVDRVVSRSQLTRAPGAYDYMPPEALELNPKYGPKLDSFSFGHLALYLLNKEYPSPYDPVSLNEVPTDMRNNQYQIFKRIRSLNKLGTDHILYEMVVECLKDDPELRWEMKRIRKELEKKMQDHSFHPPSITEKIHQREIHQKDDEEKEALIKQQQLVNKRNQEKIVELEKKVELGLINSLELVGQIKKVKDALEIAKKAADKIMKETENQQNVSPLVVRTDDRTSNKDQQSVATVSGPQQQSSSVTKGASPIDSTGLKEDGQNVSNVTPVVAHTGNLTTNKDQQPGAAEFGSQQQSTPLASPITSADGTKGDGRNENVESLTKTFSKMQQQFRKKSNSLSENTAPASSPFKNQSNVAPTTQETKPIPKPRQIRRTSSFRTTFRPHFGVPILPPLSHTVKNQIITHSQPTPIDTIPWDDDSKWRSRADIVRHFENMSKRNLCESKGHEKILQNSKKIGLQLAKSHLQKNSAVPISHHSLKQLDRPLQMKDYSTSDELFFNVTDLQTPLCVADNTPAHDPVGIVTAHPDTTHFDKKPDIEDKKEKRDYQTSDQQATTSLSNFEIISFDESGLFHYYHEYGVALIIPQGAVEGHATVQFGVSLLSTNFKCKGDFEPVSPFVWLHTEAVLSKPIELYVPHHVMAEDIEDKMKLYLLTKGHEDTDVYEVNDRIRASIGERLVQLSATHFCSVCLASTPVPRKRFYLVYAKKYLRNGSYLCKVCILYSFKCLKNFREKHEGYEITSNSCPSTFDTMKVDIHLPENSGWDFSYPDFELHCIKEEEVDIYKVLDCSASTVTKEDIEALKTYEEEGSYPPCFKLSFTPKPCLNKRCHAKVILTSDTAKWKKTISMELPGDTLLSSPTSVLSSMDSGFANGSAHSGYSYNAEGSTNDWGTSSAFDDEFFNMMTFLESKIDANYIVFGYHLGLEVKQLHQLDETLGHDRKRCIRQTLFQWRAIRSLSTDKPHEVIVKALESTGYHLLSDMVKHYLGSAIFCSMCQKSHGGNAEALNSIDSIRNFLRSSCSNAVITSQGPDIAGLNNLIAAQIPAKWELFGAQLNIGVPRMNAIKRDKGECSLCFMELFNEWKTTRSCPYTWGTVIEALYSSSLREYALAETVYKKFFKASAV